MLLPLLQNNLLTSSGGTTVNTNTGQLILTGFVPVVVLPIVVNCGLGSLTLNGFTPTVTVSNNQTVSTGVGTLSLSGFVPMIIISGGGTIINTTIFAVLD